MTAAATATPLVGSNIGTLGTAAFLAAFGLVTLVLLHAKLDHALETVGDDDTTAGSKTNCPACGARIAVDADHCEYCDRASTADGTPADADRGRTAGSASDETPDYGWLDE